LKSSDSDADRRGTRNLRSGRVAAGYQFSAGNDGALFAALVLFPFFADQYWIYLACLVSIHIVSTTGLNILTGYTGLVSLGQAAFMSVGAYTVAILEIRVGTPFIINLIVAGFVSAAVGLVVGVPCA
jgi:branched-chain amino acid transport system permease protein